MDVMYDFVESIHVFIPIIAVVFFVIMIFLFGTTRATQQPPDDYLNKLQQFDQPPVTVRPKKPRVSSVANTSSPTKQQPQSSPTKTARKPATPAAEAVADEKLSVRQRKNRSNKVAINDDSNEDEQQVDGDWVTVTPKKGKVRGGAGGVGQDDRSDSDNNTTSVSVSAANHKVQAPVSPKKDTLKAKLAPATPPPTPEVVQEKQPELKYQPVVPAVEVEVAKPKPAEPAPIVQQPTKIPVMKVDAKPLVEESVTLGNVSEPEPEPEQSESTGGEEEAAPSAAQAKDAQEQEVWQTIGAGGKKKHKKKHKAKSGGGKEELFNVDADDDADDLSSAAPSSPPAPNVARRRARKE